MGTDLTQLAYAQNSYRAFLLSPTVVGTTPKRLMAPAKHRCFLLLMAKYWFTPLMTSHYDTPEIFDKNLPVCHQEIEYP